LPDCGGIELLKEFRKDYPESLIVMATMHDDLALIREAFESGCNVFLVKPHGFMELFKRLSRLDDDPEALDNLVIDRMGVRAFRR
jgi:DNA-binding NarL/FixJ family response regulator